ncbi:MAG: M20/M25/M40 family metallo-hydrolase [Bacteroidota bacterium]
MTRRITGLLLLCVAVFIVSFKGKGSKKAKKEKKARREVAVRIDRTDKADLHTIALIKNEGFNNSKAMETLFELTDVNGPRLTGSAGMRKAEEWARAKMWGWGLENTAIEPWGGFGKGWEINKCYVAMTTPYYQPLIGVPKAWTPGTQGLVKGTAVLVKIDAVEDMAAYAGQLRNKIAVISSMSSEVKPNFTADAKRLTDEELKQIGGDPHSDDAPTNLSQKSKTGQPNARAAAMNMRRMVDSFLMHEGAAAVLSGGRGTMGTVFTSNGASRAWNAKTVLPEIEMGSEHIGRLIRLLEAGRMVEVELDVKTTFLTADSTEANVIAEIPGTDPRLKDEIVMLGGHMDSWHGSTGTTDNATGVVVMMEAMRILKTLDLKPKRTIRIALWSGEEQGLLGSRGYVKKHFADRITIDTKPAHSKVSAYYNLDNGAGKIRGIYLQGNDELRPIFTAWMEPFADLGAGTVTIKNTGSTDHISFDEVGIPGFQFIQDPLEYGTRTHHTNMDSYDRVSANDLMQASVVVASFVYQTAMREEKLPRKPMPKVNPSPESWRR